MGQMKRKRISTKDCGICQQLTNIQNAECNVWIETHYILQDSSKILHDKQRT